MRAAAIGAVRRPGRHARSEAPASACGCSRSTNPATVDPRRSTRCRHLSASSAPDGSAVLGWVSGDQEWSQSFAGGAWASAPRTTYKTTDTVFVDTRVVAHSAEQMTIFRDTNGRSGLRRIVETGAPRGGWSPRARNLQRLVGSSGLRMRTALAWQRGVGARVSECWRTPRAPALGRRGRFCGHAHESDRSVPSIAVGNEGTRSCCGSRDGRQSSLEIEPLIPNTGGATPP